MNTTTCKLCGSDACVETTLTEKLKTKLCYTCGFNTCTEYVNGSELVEKAKETLPELYKDMLFVDDENLVWFPTTLNLEESGLVFLDGTNKENCTWAAMLTKDIEPSERHKFPIPHQPGQFYTKKMDPTTLKHFEKDQFMESLDYIGYFKSEGTLVN